MAGKGDVFEKDILDLIFKGTSIANLAQNGTSPLTSLYVALHTADPTDANDQTSSEATYTNYARVGVTRDAAGWTTATAGGVSTSKNTAVINFPTCGTTGCTVTHVSIGVAGSSASKILYAGPLGSSLAVSNGITPSFAALALTVSED